MSQGAIVFTADTSQFNAPLAEASKAALNVATSAEEARRRIIAAYQQQVKAAQEAGASQTQLTSIANRASSQLASVTEDNARRYINAIDRMEDRTRRFNAARATLVSSNITAPVSSFNLGGYAGEVESAKELSRAVDGVSSAHTRGVTAGVQFGSVIRGLEGNFSRNVRAAEAFGSTLGFLTPVVEAAFPVVGAATLGYALFEMGKHAYEAFENIVNLRSAIEGLNQLQIKVDSDHNRAGDEQENSVESILEHTANRSTSLQQRLGFQSQKPIDLSSYFYSDQFKKLPDDVKGTFEQTYKNVAPADAQAKIQKITQTVKDLQAALDGVKNHTIGAFLPVINGSGPSATRNPLDYYQAQLTAAQQIRSGLTDATDVRTASLQSTQTDIAAAQAEEAKQASEKLIAARKKAAAEQLAQWELDNSDWKAAQDRSLLQDATWWQAKLDTLKRGAINFSVVQRKVNSDIIADNRQTADTIAKFTASYNEDFFKSGGLSKSDTDNLTRQGDAAKAYIQSLRQSIDLTDKDATAKANFTVKMAVATGQITKLDAAQKLANLHTADYTDALQKLQEQRDSISSSKEFDNNPLGRKAALQDNANRTDALNASRGIQVAEDNQATNPPGPSGVVGVVDALNDFVKAVRDTTSQMREFTNSALSGINRNAVAGLFGQRTNFHGLGLDLAKQGTNTLLGKAEGGILSSLGLGGTPNGSQSNPLYVRMVNAVSGAFGGGSSSSLGGLVSKGSSRIGSFLSSLLGGSKGPGFDGLDAAQGIAMGAGKIGTASSVLTDLIPLLPGLAIGGNADANSSYVVGERGPEVISMGTQPGRVTPSGDIGGSTTSHTYNIDARGATDPSAVHAAVARALPQAVAASSQVQHQRTLRRPQGR